MYNDKNIKNNNQTKICKCCGRELPLSSFAKSGKNILVKFVSLVKINNDGKREKIIDFQME